MPAFVDTSVLVAAMVADERHHTPCIALLNSGRLGFYVHGVAEAFSTLTGGRRAFRLAPNVAAELIEDDFLPALQISTLTPARMLQALREADSCGVRGGAIFDFLHLAAAREAKASRFFTLNLSNFRAFHRSGDPEIVHP